MKHGKKKIFWKDSENNWLKGNLKILLQLSVAYTLTEYQE